MKQTDINRIIDQMPLTLQALGRLPNSKYKFSRAKWYSAEMPGQATWRLSDEYNDIIEWCTERFDPHPTKPDAWSRWWVGLGVINFRDEQDYHWFILRWGA